MQGVALKSLGVSVVVLAALSLTGCGLQVRSIAVVENTEVPTLAALSEDDPEWIAYLEGQPFEINHQFCDLNAFQEQIAAQLPNFLASRLRVRSARVVNLEYIARQGNFNTITELDTVITVDGEHYMFSSGVRPGGLGSGVKLRPRPSLNFADAINDAGTSCVNTYLRIEGTLPEQTLRFDVVLNFRLRLGFSLF